MLYLFQRKHRKDTKGHTTAMTVTYRAIPCIYTSPDLGAYTAYAILCTDETGGELARLEDFSPDRREAEAFAAEITAGRLAPIHLPDAAYDFLCLAYAAD